MSVAHKAARGALWTIVSSMGGRAIGVLGTLVMTRFLHPKQIGEVSDAAILLAFATVSVSISVLQEARSERALEALRALGVPPPWRITECESASAMRTLLAGSDLLAVVQHPFLDLPQVAEVIQEIPVAERLPGLTVGLHTRADAPLTRPAAALARLLTEIGRRVLQRG